MVPSTGFQGRKSSAETDQLGEAGDDTQWYLDWLAHPASTGIWTLTGAFCQARLLSQRWESRKGAKDTERTERRMAAKKRNWEGSSENDRTRGWVSTRRSGAGQRSKSQTSFADWRKTKHNRSLLTKPGHTSRPVPFLASGLCELSPGGDGPFDSNGLCFEQPEPNELFL